MDEPLHMLTYWVEDQGIETAFREYYPELAKQDMTIERALRDLRRARQSLMARVAVLTERAQAAQAAQDEDTE